MNTLTAVSITPLVLRNRDLLLPRPWLQVASSVTPDCLRAGRSQYVRGRILQHDGTDRTLPYWHKLVRV